MCVPTATVVAASFDLYYYIRLLTPVAVWKKVDDSK